MSSRLRHLRNKLMSYEYFCIANFNCCLQSSKSLFKVIAGIFARSVEPVCHVRLLADKRFSHTRGGAAGCKVCSVVGACVVLGQILTLSCSAFKLMPSTTPQDRLMLLMVTRPKNSGESRPAQLGEYANERYMVKRSRGNHGRFPLASAFSLRTAKVQTIRLYVT
jgi:hypothetical protein